MRTGTGPVLLSSRRTWLEVVPAAGGHVPRRPAPSAVRVVRPRDPIPVVHAVGPHVARALRGAVVARADARINPVRTGVRHLLLVPRVGHGWLLFFGELPLTTVVAISRRRRLRTLSSVENRGAPVSGSPYCTKPFLYKMHYQTHKTPIHRREQ